MVQVGRPGLSLGQKKELWRRWKEGQFLSEIGRALGKHAGSIHGIVKTNGGIVPAERSRVVRVLSLSDREEISRGLARNASMRTIAARIGRAPSTVSREIGRHGGRESIGRSKPMIGCGRMRNDLKHVYWLRIRHLARWWPSN